ncbi:MAG: dynamin family protein [Candidatus Heimdallarchaeaceae archaeon]
MEFIKKQQRLEEVVSKHNDIIGTISRDLNAKYALQTSAKNIQAINKMDTDGRLLRIGIVGRVNAGKSSLLNALFFDGKSILPKAATPMTAALTIMSFGNKLYAEADFFSESDLQEIKENHDKYISVKDRLYRQKKERFTEKKEAEVRRKKAEFRTSYKLSKEEIRDIDERAEKSAQDEMKSDITLSAAFEQYNMIGKSKIEISDLKSKSVIPAKTLSDLRSKLGEYVGATGKYTPFTKSVVLKMFDENLKDIEIVDTPGINDPVRSREERTRELLKYCDVVLVVSPAGHFMSASDVELLDRITMKEGITEIYALASQVDNALIGSPGSDSDWNLHKALNLVTIQLSEQMHDTLRGLRNRSPEVGDCYDQLISGKNKEVLLTSAISETLLKSMKNPEQRDSGTKHVWQNLKENYPNYFSDTDTRSTSSNLIKLGNISGVRDVIKSVREKKNQILAKRKNDFLKAKLNSLNDYKKEMFASIELTLGEINNGDIADLKKKRGELQKVKSVASVYLDEKYSVLIRDLVINLKKSMIKTLEDFMAIDVTDTIETVPVEVVVKRRSCGRSPITGIIQEPILRTGAVTALLESEARRVENTISIETQEIINQWRANTPSALIKEIRSRIDDEYLMEHILIRALSRVLNKIVEPELDYEFNLPYDLVARGTIRGAEVEQYLNNLHLFKSKYHRSLKYDINSFLKNLESELFSIKLSEEFFSNYDEILAKLQDQISNKEIILDSFDRLVKDLNGIK